MIRQPLLSALIMISVLAYCGHTIAQSTPAYNQIVIKFEYWKAQQFKSGKFATDKNCIPDTVAKKNYKGPDMGIPKDLDISFTDINRDGIIDGLVTFHPDQCDGGNALMNAQISVLILSTKKGYTIDDTFMDKITEGYTGWFIIEKATESVLFGTYYNYKNGDGRCCPGIRKPFELNYLTGKLTL